MYFAVPLFKAMQKKTDNINLVFREGLTGVRVIRAFRQDDFEQNRFEGVNQDYTQNAVKVFSIIAAVFPVMTLIMSGTNIGITDRVYDLRDADSDEFHDAFHDLRVHSACSGISGTFE